MQAVVTPEQSSKKSSNSLAQGSVNVQQSQCTRPNVIHYHLVPQPKKAKKANSITASSTFGALIDVTNRGAGVVGGEAKGEMGRNRRPSSTVTSTSAALNVFDYGLGTPPPVGKLSGSKCRSNATGQLV